MSSYLIIRTVTYRHTLFPVLGLLCCRSLRIGSIDSDSSQSHSESIGGLCLSSLSLEVQLLHGFGATPRFVVDELLEIFRSLKVRSRQRDTRAVYGRRGWQDKNPRSRNNVSPRRNDLGIQRTFLMVEAKGHLREQRTRMGDRTRLVVSGSIAAPLVGCLTIFFNA